MRWCFFASIKGRHNFTRPMGPREITFRHVWELLRTDLSESSRHVRSVSILNACVSVRAHE
jgi:hypothetical protein